MRRATSFGVRILQVLLATFLVTVSSFAASVTLAWDPNTEPDVAGYRVYYGTSSGTYTQSVDAGNATTIAIPNLLDGTTYYFAVTAYNTAAFESAWSNEITYTPTAPTNTPPTVALTAPANGGTYLSPANISFNASASDADGSIAKVEFYSGTVKLSEDTTSPYTFSWIGVPAGSYTLSARAVDNLGAQTTSATASIVVSTPNQSPTIAITSPTTSSLYTSPASISINAAATDSDGSVAFVEFYNGSTKLGEDTSSPFAFSWSGVAPGTYSLKAVAVDDLGFAATSAIVNVTVRAPNQAPTVAMTTPIDGAVMNAPANVTMTASASDPDGTISKVEFFQGSTKLGEDLSSPYSFTLANLPAGNYPVLAVATDNSGASATSSIVNITVNAPPSVILSTNGTSFPAPASITLTAAPSDSDGTISKVEFFNGSTKLGEKIDSPYTFTWNNVAAGSYSLTARATDDRGAVTASEGVSVTVTAANQPPTVAISTTSGSTAVSSTPYVAPASITLYASASDPDGTIARVDFYQGATKLGQDTSSPYAYAWSNVAAGSYSITAVAVDNAGATATSAPLTITVKPAPNVVLTTNGTSFNPGAAITMTASTAQLSGRVRRVEFYRDSVLLYKDTKSPYSYSWKSVPAGTYSLKAIAVMNSGATYTSTPIHVTVGIAQPSAMMAMISSYEDPMPTVTPSFQSDGTLSLGITGKSGQIYNVWASTDLKEWTLMTTVANESGFISVIDSDAPAHKQRFYRVSVQE